MLAAAVGAKGVPVRVGEAKFAFKFKDASTLLMLAFKFRAVCVAVDIGLLASDVSSALPKPIILFVIPPTVPVKVGEAKSAFKFKDASTLLMLAFKFRAVCVAVEIGLLASDVLSALPKPTIPFEMPPTVPVKVGEAKSAFKFKDASTYVMLVFKSKADCVEVEIGLLASEVLSALPKPTMPFEMPLTVPVNVGDAMSAFKFSDASI